MEASMNALVLCAGKHQRIEGARHHDIYPFDGIQILKNLDDKDWNILQYGTYDLIVCHHGVEHLFSLINFMDNCHTLLNENGILEIITPNAGINPDLENCDPQHIRCYRKATFSNYFTQEGIDKFGYTDKAWQILELSTFRTEITDDTIVVKLTPIK